MSRDPWAAYQQPTLASAQVPPDLWEAGRLPAHVVPLSAEVSTAAELVHAGGCSPQCLVSAGVPVQHCDCACRGAYHGILADADLRTALARTGCTVRSA